MTTFATMLFAAAKVGKSEISDLKFADSVPLAEPLTWPKRLNYCGRGAEIFWNPFGKELLP